MIIVLIISIIISLLVGVYLFIGVYLFMSMPGKHRKGMEKFARIRYAHRGLHNDKLPENSLSAFRAAVEHGFGIELDVRLSKDGQVVVFHDDELKRVTGINGAVIDKTAQELASLSLSGSAEGVPTFAQVLDMVGGKVPLLVEIKYSPVKYQRENMPDLTELTMQMLRDYREKYHGEFIIESFNPMLIGQVKGGMPEVYRGVLADRFLFGEDKSLHGPLYFMLHNLLGNFFARPDFIAYCHTGWKNLSLRFIRKAFKTTTLCWTVRSQQEEDEAFAHGFDGVIFENYLPDSPYITKN